MFNLSISKHYAQNLFEVCQENNIVDNVLYEIKTLQKIHDQQIIKFLTIPTIKKNDKKETLDELVVLGYEKVLVNLLKVLIDNNHISLFNTILDEFQKIYQDFNKIKIINITVARKLSEDNLNILKVNLERNLNKFIVLNVMINESIIGGIKIEFDSFIIDNTISTQLKNLSKN